MEAAKFQFYFEKNRETLKIPELGSKRSDLFFLERKMILVAWHRMDWGKRESRGKLGDCCNHLGKRWANLNKAHDTGTQRQGCICGISDVIGFPGRLWTWVHVCIFMHLKVLGYGEKKRKIQKWCLHPYLDNQEQGGKGLKIIWRL